MILLINLSNKTHKFNKVGHIGVSFPPTASLENVQWSRKPVQLSVIRNKHAHPRHLLSASLQGQQESKKQSSVGTRVWSPSNKTRSVSLPAWHTNRPDYVMTHLVVISSLLSSDTCLAKSSPDVKNYPTYQCGQYS